MLEAYVAFGCPALPALMSHLLLVWEAQSNNKWDIDRGGRARDPLRSA